MQILEVCTKVQKYFDFLGRVFLKIEKIKKVYMCSHIFSCRSSAQLSEMLF